MKATFTTAGGVKVYVLSDPDVRSDGTVKVMTFRDPTDGFHGSLHLHKLTPTNAAAVAMCARASVEVRT